MRTKEPVAINTKLGWVLSGPVTNDESDNTTTAVLIVHTLQIESAGDQLDRTLKSFWELETFEVEPTENKTYDHPIHTVELKEGHYEVSLIMLTGLRSLTTNSVIDSVSFLALGKL